MSYEVNSVIEVIQQGGRIGGLTFSTKSLASPYVKNYDAYDKGPLNWRNRFDISRYRAAAIGVWPHRRALTE